MSRTYEEVRRWIQLGWRKALVYPLCRGLYRDHYPAMERTLLIAGAGRSGTTWLAEVLAAERPCRIMFEPFNPRKVAAFAPFHYFQYRRPETDDPVLEAFCRELFSGRVRHPWIDRQVDCLRPRYRVIKEIRANLLLRWIRQRFPELPLLLLIRHPCAVVSSRLHLGWDTDRDIEPFLAQAELVYDHLGDKIDLIRSYRSDVEKHAVVWSISNLVPLRQFEPGALSIVYYENLVREPETELPRAFRILQLEYDRSVLARISRPSATSVARSPAIAGRADLERWQRDLSSDQIDRILAVVDAFGLGHLYGQSAIPLSGSR